MRCMFGGLFQLFRGLFKLLFSMRRGYLRKRGYSSYCLRQLRSGYFQQCRWCFVCLYLCELRSRLLQCQQWVFILYCMLRRLLQFF